MRKLHISNTDKKLLGVCGGIAETYDIDPTLLRLGVVFFCLVTGIVPVLLTYVIAYFIMPKEEGY